MKWAEIIRVLESVSPAVLVEASYEMFMESVKALLQMSRVASLSVYPRFGIVASDLQLSKNVVQCVHLFFWLLWFFVEFG